RCLCVAKTGYDAFRRQTVVKLDDGTSDNSCGQLFDHELSRGGAIAGAQRFRLRETSYRISQRARIFDRHQQSGLILEHDLAATGRIGCNQRLAAGGSLQEAHGQTFAVRGQDSHVAGAPERYDVVDMPKPGDPWTFIPLLDLAECNRGW